MIDNKEALRLELRQIIQMDRMAADIIQGANDTRKSLEKRCEIEKKEIVAAAEKSRLEMEQRAQAAHADALLARKNAATESFTSQKRLLGEKVEEKRAEWVDEITQTILKM